MSSSQSQSSSSMSRAGSQGNCLDPLDSLIDFSEYEQVSYQSPSISPSNSKQPQYTRPVATTPSANTLLPQPQPLSGPSHPYDLHKQQTGIPSGGLANTLAINSAQMYGYGFSSGLSPADDFIDFNSAPRQSFSGLDIDMEFDSPSTEPAFFFPDNSSNGDFKQDFINPSSINDMPSSSVLPTQSSNVGRLWPGMHQQQAALAKAQQQQKLQQQLIQQQQRQGSVAQQPRQQRPKTHHVADPIVEEKISQLLHSMRQGSVATSEGDDASTPHGNMSHASRMRKEEEDMDEDERLLASEEGKKLSSKERRQLRNKVSARAFRSRRKEYIGQLEGEIAVKVNENSDLRAQNKALMEENTRLSDLTRMLLSSPSFSGFLDNLSSNPTAVAPQQQAAPVQNEQRQVENRQVRKDVNPYAAQQQMQNQQINFTMIPEQSMDFSMLDLNGDGSYIYQPQVFSVLSMPEVTFNTAVLSGKSSNFVGQSFDSEAEKVTIPVIERMPFKEEAVVESSPVIDEEFDNDPAFTLFTDAPTSITSQTSTDSELTPLFAGIQSDKEVYHLEVVEPTEDETAAAMARVQQLCQSLEAVTSRLEAMTVNY